MKPDFDKAEKAARLLRVAQPADNLSLSVLKMKFDLPIIFETFQNYAKITGINVDSLIPCSGLKNGYLAKINDNKIYLVLYDGDCSYGKEHMNWTLAHEVGHIYLGHKKDEEIEEIEAHWFAAELLAPEIIIRKIAQGRQELGKKVDAYDIMNLFDLSFEASNKRIDSLNRKRSWLTYLGGELTSKYEKQISHFILKGYI